MTHDNAFFATTKNRGNWNSSFAKRNQTTNIRNDRKLQLRLIHYTNKRSRPSRINLAVTIITDVILPIGKAGVSIRNSSV